MATVLIYLSEILPLKLRAKGAALAAAADLWFVSTTRFERLIQVSMYSQVVQITPSTLRKTYIISAVFNFVNTCIVWGLYPETAGLTLESVDDLFRIDDEPAGGQARLKDMTEKWVVSPSDAKMLIPGRACFREKADSRRMASTRARRSGVRYWRGP